MQKLLIATTNTGKVKELSEFLGDLPIELVSLKDVGITAEVEETGTTYEENSRLKAVTYAKLSGLPAISDDVGLEIAALAGEPGVQSRYWAGPEGRDEDIIEKMKTVAKELPDENRHATFRAVITLALPTGEYWQMEGKVDGIVAKKPLLKILQGYPYRSFFYIPEIKKYYHKADLSEEETTIYNHRKKAIEKLKPLILQKLALLTKQK